jgi:AraC-like DNA-binding protein
MPDLTSQWNLTSGANPMLMGRIQTSGCEPHFHDTFTIAFLRQGTASVTVRNQFWQFRRGEAFLGNPYEVHAGICPDSAFDYDVYYPSVDLLTECAGLDRNAGRQLRFRTSFLRDPVLVRQFAEALSGTERGGARGELPGEYSTAEDGLRRFLQRNRQLIYVASQEEVVPIREACRILQQSTDTSINWADLPRRVGCSRRHFIRLFYRSTGLVPSAYFRQLRLAKALRLICSDHSIADAAADTGFTDQAHFTREFKRAFGRTPGKIVRDIVASSISVSEKLAPNHFAATTPISIL